MNNNQLTADKLNKMDLSTKALNLINNTDINIIDTLFGNCETADEVEAVIIEMEN